MVAPEPGRKVFFEVLQTRLLLTRFKFLVDFRTTSADVRRWIRILDQGI